jgi:hypothetical protein
MANDAADIELLVRQHRQPELELLLESNSKLPGPRANLELAAAFADAIASAGISPWTRDVLDQWSRIAADTAPGDQPRSFLPFCAVQAAGALWLNSPPATQADLLLLVERAASDPRWRVREAAAIALQRIGLSDFSALEGILKQWSSEASLLEWRAIIAALAEPRLLNHDDRARTALDFGARAVRALESVPPADRRKDDFLALRKCLAYGLSVFAAALPSEGFALLTSLARSKDAAVVWVVGENLKKQRLAGSHADAVNAVRQLLD